MIKLVLWDLHGTLLDDIPAWYTAVRETFLAFGAQPPTLDEYFMELEGHQYWELYTRRGVRASFGELNAVYGKVYGQQMSQIVLTRSARETLRALKTNGIPCGIVSAQIAELFKPIFSRLQLAPYFSYAYYPVTAKAEKINEIMMKERISPQQCIYVGDTPSDVRSAQKAGMVSVAYLNGYVPKTLIDATNPDHTIRDLKEILAIVK